MQGRSPWQIHFAPLLIALLPILSAPAARAAQVVDLPASPPARRTVALQELWRVGADPDEVLLGLVCGGVLDGRGNVLLADRQLCRVAVISPEGEFLGTLGRKGEGPGEIGNLQGVFAAGDRVGLVQAFPGKVVYVRPDGEAAGGFTLGRDSGQGGFHAIRDLRCAAGVLVAHMDRSTDDFAADRSLTAASLSVLDFDGAVQGALAVHEVSRGLRKVVLDEAAAWSEFSCWAVSPRGVVATVAARDAWAVNERGLDGELRRVLRRPGRSCGRTVEQKEEAVSRIRLASLAAGATIDKKPLDDDPVIIDLQYAADGRLFVTTCGNGRERLEAGVAGRCDVIDADGRFQEEVTFTFPGHDPQNDVLVFLDGVRFLILRNYEDAEAALYAAFLPEEEREKLGEAQPLEVVCVTVR